MGPRGDRLFALTIGINNYRDPHSEFPALKGCVADADAVDDYLISKLSVPESRVTRLRDAQATRTNIIQAFISLKDDERIQYGDPILIYFAGHGGETRAPNGWPCSSGKVQMIIPQDCGLALANGEIVHGIPDLTIGWHLKCLAERKGNNITVILDNCYSGSGTRSLGSVTEHSNGSGIRAVRYRGQLPPTLDDYTRSGVHALPQDQTRGPASRGLRIASDYVSSGLRSHVLLAACKSDEYAREVNRRGVFTRALLQTLSNLDVAKITYKELLDRIPQLPANQNPQCEGHAQNRFIFDARISTRPNGIPFRGRINLTNRALTINAGIAHGLGKGDVLNIWGDINGYANKNSPLWTATISQVTASTSVLEVATYAVNYAVPGSFVAELLESKRPVLYLHVAPEMRVVLEGIARVMQTPPRHRADIVISPLQTANISITYEQQGFCFDILNDEVNHHGLKRLPHTVPANASDMDFHRIFHRISIYEYYLRQIKGTSSMEGKVSLEFYRIKKPTQPGGEDWNHAEIHADNLAIDGAGIDLVQDGSWYVIKLTNTTSKNLYPALFYFDNCDYSIDSLYEPPSAGAHIADPPLKAGGSITVGYGSEGVSPFVLDIDIRRPHDMEVGFVKLFVSTQYVDYSHIRQESPFNIHSRGIRPFDKDRRSEYFGSIIVPLVVRRHPSVRSTRGIDLSKSEPSRAPQITAQGPDGSFTSVFNPVSINVHGLTIRTKLRSILKKLKRGEYFHRHHSPSEPLHEQSPNLHVSGERHAHETYRHSQGAVEERAFQSHSRSGLYHDTREAGYWRPPHNQVAMQQAPYPHPAVYPLQPLAIDHPHYDNTPNYSATHHQLYPASSPQPPRYFSQQYQQEALYQTPAPTFQDSSTSSSQEDGFVGGFNPAINPHTPR